MNKRNVLKEADAIVNGQRQTDYGDKRQNFAQIAMIWQGILATKLQKEAAITPEDVALLMIGVKMARLAKSPDHYDSIMDIAGYAACMDTLQQERSAQQSLLGATNDARDHSH